MGALVLCSSSFLFPLPRLAKETENKNLKNIAARQVQTNKNSFPFSEQSFRKHKCFLFVWTCLAFPSHTKHPSIGRTTESIWKMRTLLVLKENCFVWEGFSASEAPKGAEVFQVMVG